MNPATREVKLIDFSLSSELSRERPELRLPNQLEGTLAYISPEQTGRMNRDLDYRTDYYSLGVTFLRAALRRACRFRLRTCSATCTATSVGLRRICAT